MEPDDVRRQECSTASFSRQATHRQAKRSSGEKIPLAAIEAFLTERNFQPVEVPFSPEVTFGRIIKNGPLTGSLRVYTSYGRTDGTTSIEVQPAYKYNGKVMGCGRRHAVQHRPTWAENLDKAIRLASEEFLPCPACGHALVEREGKTGKFWGCVTYRDTQCPGRPTASKPQLHPLITALNDGADLAEGCRQAIQEVEGGAGFFFNGITKEGMIRLLKTLGGLP